MGIYDGLTQYDRASTGVRLPMDGNALNPPRPRPFMANGFGAANASADNLLPIGRILGFELRLEGPSSSINSKPLLSPPLSPTSELPDLCWDGGVFARVTTSGSGSCICRGGGGEDPFAEAGSSSPSHSKRVAVFSSLTFIMGDRSTPLAQAGGCSGVSSRLLYVLLSASFEEGGVTTARVISYIFAYTNEGR